jgi:hypothetical protein
MDDSDIGRIWKRLNEDCAKGESCNSHGDMWRLLRSLVLERTKHVGEDQALSDFRIDRESWGSK